jgi:hypothetical protein
MSFLHPTSFASSASIESSMRSFADGICAKLTTRPQPAPRRADEPRSEVPRGRPSYRRYCFRAAGPPGSRRSASSAASNSCGEWTGQLLCGRGQETGHENDEGSSPPEEIGRKGGDHGLHAGLGRRKNHSAALVFATFFRAESDYNSSHPSLPFRVDSGAGVKSQCPHCLQPRRRIISASQH